MERYHEAIKIYYDVEDFFSTNESRKYLTKSISIDNVREVLEELSIIFVDEEDYEKCSQIQKWKSILDKEK